MAIGVAVPGSAADPPGIVQFIAIGSDAGAEFSLAEAQKSQAMFERLGFKAKRRFIRATLAGDFSGTLSLMIEYPNLGELASAQAKLARGKGDAPGRSKSKKSKAKAAEGGLTASEKTALRDMEETILEAETHVKKCLKATEDPAIGTDHVEAQKRWEDLVRSYEG